MLVQSISRNSLLLGLFAAFTTAAIAGTFLFTKDTIAEQERIAANKALLEIFPAYTHDNILLDDVLSTNDSNYLSLNEPSNIHIAAKKGSIVGYILPVIAPDAYTEKIRMLVGLKKDGSIAGVRVIQHRETPGLGDAVETQKSDWILNFNEKSLSNLQAEKWAVKKDGGEFDQFTGATITPRAVTKAIYNSLQYYAANQKALEKDAQALLARKANSSETNQSE